MKFPEKPLRESLDAPSEPTMIMRDYGDTVDLEGAVIPLPDGIYGAFVMLPIPCKSVDEAEDTIKLYYSAIQQLTTQLAPIIAGQPPVCNNPNCPKHGKSKHHLN